MRLSRHFKTISQILIFLVVGFLISLWCSGCALFAGGNLKELETLPTAPDTPLKATLDFTYSHFGYQLNHRERDLAEGSSIKSALEAFEKTGYFSEIGPTVADPDLQINVNFLHKAKSDRTYKLAVWTLLLIPTVGVDQFIIDAEVNNLRTGQTRSYHLEDSVIMYAQTLLILFIPFQIPYTIYDDVRQNMYKHLGVKMHEDGLLTTAQTATQ